MTSSGLVDATPPLRRVRYSSSAPLHEVGMRRRVGASGAPPDAPPSPRRPTQLAVAGARDPPRGVCPRRVRVRVAALASHDSWSLPGAIAGALARHAARLVPAARDPEELATRDAPTTPTRASGSRSSASSTTSPRARRTTPPAARTPGSPRATPRRRFTPATSPPTASTPPSTRSSPTTSRPRSPPWTSGRSSTRTGTSASACSPPGGIATRAGRRRRRPRVAELARGEPTRASARRRRRARPPSRRAARGGRRPRAGRCGARTGGVTLGRKCASSRGSGG